MFSIKRRCSCTSIRGMCRHHLRDPILASLHPTTIAMRVFSRFRRPDPPPPPPPYQFADPSAAHHSELAASLVPPPMPRRVSRTSTQRSVLAPVQQRTRAGLSALPLSVLHRVCELMLVVPRGWDEDADAARARAALYGLRGVDRRFFLGTYLHTNLLASRLG